MKNTGADGPGESRSTHARNKSRIAMPTDARDDTQPEDSAGSKAAILQIIGNVLVARSLAIAAELGLADLVQTEPQSVTELAHATGTHADSLYRLLRMLASYGVFAEDDGGLFHPTPMSLLLETDRPDSLRDLLTLGWQDIAWDTYRQLPHTIRTGETAFDAAFGATFFDYLAGHPEANASFDSAMALFSGPENGMIAAAYDFGQFARIVDVGGGTGGLMAAILSAHQGVRGVLFDQPQVVANMTGIEASAIRERCEPIGGDFFESVPAAADAYIMKRILHDWDDEAAIRLLLRCREAMNTDARVLVIDAVMQAGNAPDPNKFMDVSIMALTRGRERSETEFQRLFTEAGLRCTEVFPTELPSTLSIIEGVRA